MIKITLMVVLCMSVFAFSSVKVQAKDEAIDLRAKAAILIDADSGKILYEKNANKAYGIASGFSSCGRNFVSGMEMVSIAGTYF